MLVAVFGLCCVEREEGRRARKGGREGQREYREAGGLDVRKPSWDLERRRCTHLDWFDRRDASALTSRHIGLMTSG